MQIFDNCKYYALKILLRARCTASDVRGQECPCHTVGARERLVPV